MTTILPRIRLYLVAGAALVFLGGLLVATGRWNRAATDRAFVDAAALAASNPPPVGGVRYWAPTGNGVPAPILRVRIEAAERLRQIPALPALPQTPRSSQTTQTGSPPTDKPPAAPK